MKKILPVHPWPMHPMIAEALAKMEDVKPVEAIPGGPGPILAIKKMPEWACDAVIVMMPERLIEAVHVCLEDGIELVTTYGWLSNEIKKPAVEFRELVEELRNV